MTDLPKPPIRGVPPELLDKQRRLRHTRLDRGLTALEEAELKQVEDQIQALLNPKSDVAEDYSQDQQRTLREMERAAYALRAKVEPSRTREKLPVTTEQVTRFHVRKPKP